MSEAKIPETLGAGEMARLLSITPRRLQELAKRGTLPRSTRGLYPVQQCVDQFLAHRVDDARTRAGSASADRLRDRRADQIDARMKREDASLIELDEAVQALGEMRNMFLNSLAEPLPTSIARHYRSPRDRRRIRSIIGAEHDRLTVAFDRRIEQLRTGRQDPEDVADGAD